MAPKSKPKARSTKVASPQETRSTTKRKRTDDDKEAVTSRPKKVIKQETRDCDICTETKTVYRDFPKPPSCNHDATVCKDCYQKHFKIRIEEHRDLGWNACNCPLCGQNVTEDEARGMLRRPISKEFDKLITKMAQQTAENWIWCPARGCGHGQSHKPKKESWVKCSNCKSKICFHHQRLWHQGLTCKEFDEMANQDKAAQKDREIIRTTTKACPFCKRRIRKDGGCNHMICTGCRKEWMWNDVPFDGETRATQAEILGKRGGAPPLTGEQRQNVERVMAANNARIDQENARHERRANTILLIPTLGGVHQFLGNLVPGRTPYQLPPVVTREVSPLPVRPQASEQPVLRTNQHTAQERTQPFHRRALNNIATFAAGITNRMRATFIDLTVEDDGAIEQQVRMSRQAEVEHQQRRRGGRLMGQNDRGLAGNRAGSSRNNPVDLTLEDEMEEI